ncbi:TIGR02302 family protein [Pseudovibrio sp. SPO723]|uniref:TIGR02302 family protein n=1 Tax=Nesiotobacter zosterae TaxID=392721 RepID=UPI0029C5D468|nr:TIGR02302 family protein [Pseudovibrio sp. SPO723]MDX5595166.1 TIGR02302 family protein [Pseudovibrio sp. SPO723]
MADKAPQETQTAPHRRSHSALALLFSRSLDGQVYRLQVRAGAYQLFEQVWPNLVPPAILAVFYIAISFLGVWAYLPWFLSGLVAVGFIAGGLWLARGLLAVRLPTRTQAIRRIEQSSGLSHAPLQSLEDTIALGRDDPASQALWAFHQKKLLERVRALKVDGPKTRGFLKDPYGLRALAAMVLVVAVAVSGPDRWNTLSQPFSLGPAGTQIPPRIDAWVTPPAYTGEAPIFLSGVAQDLRDANTPFTVPEGSELLVRVQNGPDLEVVLEGGAAEALTQDEDEADKINTGAREWQFKLTENVEVAVKDGGDTAQLWRFAVQPDRAPSIAYLADPEPQLSGSLRFQYTISDDYGVASASAVIQQRPDSRNLQSDPRPLIEAPDIDLSLPARPATEGNGETFKDLTAHPWAGSEVNIQLQARDQAGKMGVSEQLAVVLPERRFSKPLARAVVEQRRELAMDANQHVQVIDAFDALMIAPEEFIDDAGIYLPLRLAYRQLVAAETDDELRAVIEVLWTLALAIEDGDLSVAEQALRDAQEELRRALEEGASEEEIARLMDNLRNALQEYLQALMQQMQQNPQAMQQMPMDPNMQQINPQDLDEMMRRMEELARQGSLEAARELLSQMQQMLENLQTARPQAPSQQQQQMMETLNQLGEMIQRQQELMDDTHQYAPNKQDDRMRSYPNQSGEPMSPEELEQALQQLQRQQGDLSDQLQQMLDELANNGMGQNDQLEGAGESMDDARGALGQSEPGQALGDQGRALEQLRQGAQQLAEQMAGEGNGPGMTQNSPFSQDPLGRMRRTEGPDFGDQVKVPDEIDIQRARRILEELRRRFSDPERPELELDYLERLLKRY